VSSFHTISGPFDHFGHQAMIFMILNCSKKEDDILFTLLNHIKEPVEWVGLLILIPQPCKNIRMQCFPTTLRTVAVGEVNLCLSSSNSRTHRCLHRATNKHSSDMHMHTLPTASICSYLCSEMWRRAERYGWMNGSVDTEQRRGRREGGNELTLKHIHYSYWNKCFTENNLFPGKIIEGIRTAE